MMKSVLIQIIFFAAVFLGISWVQEWGMLSATDTAPKSLTHFTSLNGEQIELKKNQEKTIVYFFAPWCQVCNFSIENLEKIHQKKPNIQIIAVALDYQTKNAVADFVSRHKLSFDIALGTYEHKLGYKIKGYPSYYVLDENFQVTGKSMGYSSETGIWLRTL